MKYIGENQCCYLDPEFSTAYRVCGINLTKPYMQQICFTLLERQKPNNYKKKTLIWLLHNGEKNPILCMYIIKYGYGAYNCTSKNIEGGDFT